MTALWYVYETRDGWQPAQSPGDIPPRPPISTGRYHPPAKKRIGLGYVYLPAEPVMEQWWVKDVPVSGPHATEQEAYKAAKQVADTTEMWG